MLNSFRISSGCFPLIMLATVLQPTSLGTAENRGIQQALLTVHDGRLQQWLDVEVVGGEDDLKEHLLVDVDELLVPFGDLGRLLAGVVEIFGQRLGVLSMVLAPFNDLCSGFSAFVWLTWRFDDRYCTLFRTDEETLGRGIASSVSPMSADHRDEHLCFNSSGCPAPRVDFAGSAGRVRLTFEHVLDEDRSNGLRKLRSAYRPPKLDLAATHHLLVDVELLVVGRGQLDLLSASRAARRRSRGGRAG